MKGMIGILKKRKDNHINTPFRTYHFDPGAAFAKKKRKFTNGVLASLIELDWFSRCLPVRMKAVGNRTPI